jgi:DNA helicase II / ATP-dependent DNA helicase PcrA
MARKYQLKTRQSSSLGIDYQNLLNQEQRDIAMAENGPLMVLAGAGTGKTRALTFRVARFLDMGLSPDGIILLTFTNRAAKEMVSRIEEICGPAAKRILGGTFHHVANILLRRYANAIGYESNFTILDPDDAREVMSAAVQDVGISPRKGRFPKPDVLRNFVSFAINTQTPVRDVIAKRAPRFYAIADDVAAVCRAYIERKASMNMMDFDDLLMNWKVLLEEVPHVAEELKRNTKAILVDEYQDTNLLQGSIVDLMAMENRNITVVGDDAQCIYGFRGSEVRNMLAFAERYPDATLRPLTVNYRSTPEILNLANASISRAKEGFHKTLRSVRPSGVLPALVACRDVFVQAEFVAQRILELRDEGVPLSDIAILYRAHSQAIELQVEFTRRGIPFLVRSGLRFFEQAHIKDVLAYLRVLYNPGDELAFRRCVKLHEGIGNATADSLWNQMRDLQESMRQNGSAYVYDTLLESVGKRVRTGLRVFVGLMQSLSASSMGKQPGEMIRTILEAQPVGGDYSNYLYRRYPNANERNDDIAQLADYAGGFESVEEFLNELALVQSFTVEEAVAADEPDEKVTLSSIHQSKGLEWSRVFIPWLTEGRFPSDLALREEEGEHEERRLFYVAVTRAKDEVILTHPQIHRNRDYSQILLRRSRFIEELPEPREEAGETIGMYEIWQLEEIEETTTEKPDERIAEEGPSAARLSAGHQNPTEEGNEI